MEKHEYVIGVEDVRKKFKTYDTNNKGFLASLRRRYYYKQALKGVSLYIKQGEIVALLGKNGSGKSTLIKILTGILYPDSGDARILGIDPWHMREDLAMDIGVVLGAHGQLYWNLSALDTFELMRHIYRIPEREFNKRLKYFISELELEKVYRRQVRTLSLGEQMKCNFVASVLHMPKIVFLDEPTIGVDLSSKASLINIIYEMQKEHNTTFILTTHIVEDISIAERVVMLDNGRKVYDGSKYKLMRLFGDKKEIELHFDGDAKKRDYIRYGKVIKKDINYLRLEVDRSMLKNPKFIKLISAADVIDYSVSEPGLGKVILKLYGKSKSR